MSRWRRGCLADTSSRWNIVAFCLTVFIFELPLLAIYNFSINSADYEFLDIYNRMSFLALT